MSYPQVNYADVLRSAAASLSGEGRHNQSSILKDAASAFDALQASAVQKDAALAAAINALEKSDPWKQISTEPSFEFECIHCGEKYDMMAEFRDNHAADCIWLSAALSAANGSEK